MMVSTRGRDQLIAGQTLFFFVFSCFLWFQFLHFENVTADEGRNRLSHASRAPNCRVLVVLMVLAVAALISQRRRRSPGRQAATASTAAWAGTTARTARTTPTTWTSSLSTATGKLNGRGDRCGGSRDGNAEGGMKSVERRAG